jgi:hypothetical protein
VKYTNAQDAKDLKNMKQTNWVEAENALPKEIKIKTLKEEVKIKRVCEGVRIPQCYWTIEIKTWNKRKFEGIVSDYQVRGLLKKYTPYKGYPKYIFEVQYEQNIK